MHRKQVLMIEFIAGIDEKETFSIIACFIPALRLFPFLPFTMGTWPCQFLPNTRSCRFFKRILLPYKKIVIRATE